ncbi:hypothetical protein niasHS_010110 [Heterodera schachtii]|uniref:Group XV phospholipase A2 n=1 Tax=Heterodera schachtii TaxID=97005 RepID=A0ABD2J0D4_HETSC
MIDSSKRSPSRYFAPIVASLAKLGYQRGIDVVGAPYDWRRAPEELLHYFVKLRSLIEQLYHANGNRKVIVLAHSMGNPMANFFYNKIVDKNWKDTFLLSHISLAGAWGGSAQICRPLPLFGYNMDYFRVLLPPSRLRAMQRSFTSSAFLFPSAALWKSDEILATTPRQNYSLSNLDKFFADIQYPEGFDQWKSASEALVLEPPGVKVHCIFGVGVDTPDQFQWAHNWFFPDYQPYIRYGDGDGTVNIRSLEVCERWAKETADGTVEVHRVNGTDHMGILNDQRTLELIRDILTKGEGRRKEENSTTK